MIFLESEYFITEPHSNSPVEHDKQDAPTEDVVHNDRSLPKWPTQ